MEIQVQNTPSVSRREPWNKGKLIGQKPPLRPKHVWSIRTRLQIEGRTRDLAMFNLAIDSKLRGCDVVAIRVEDVAPSGYAVDRATVRQRKTGRPVRFELTEQTRQALDDYIKAAGKKPANFCSVAVVIATAACRPGSMLGSSRAGLQQSASTRTFSARILFDVPKPTLIYGRTGNLILRAVQPLLGHTKIESTVRYLGIEVDDALAIAEQVDV